MIVLINIAIVLACFAGMEGVAWLSHKYLMHGWLWFLHADHHRKGEGSFFERNDFFFLIFATPGITLLFTGLAVGLAQPYFWAGLGIALYGFTYFLVHDVFIHQRFKWLRHTDNVYFRAIRKAHKVHHKKLTKEDGACFGMLWVPLRYFREAKSAGQ
jgi:beta-carotene 3-hydroxylase